MPPALSFNPPPPLAAAILDDLCDPSLSLAEIASAAGIVIEALSAWTIRPDIQEKLAGLATAASFRARLLAALNLPSAVEIIAAALKGCTDDENASGRRDTPEAIAARQTRRTESRRAASLLLRIARYHFELTPHSPPGRVRVLAGEGFASSPSTPSPSHGATDDSPSAPPPDPSVSLSISASAISAHLNAPSAAEISSVPQLSTPRADREPVVVALPTRRPSKPASDTLDSSHARFDRSAPSPRSSNSPHHLLTSSPPQPAGP